MEVLGDIEREERDEGEGGWKKVTTWASIFSSYATGVEVSIKYVCVDIKAHPVILLCRSNNINIPCTGRNCLMYWVFHWTAASTTYEVDTTCERRCFQRPLWTGGAALPIMGKLLKKKKKKKMHLATNLT